MMKVLSIVMCLLVLISFEGCGQKKTSSNNSDSGPSVNENELIELDKDHAAAKAAKKKYHPIFVCRAQREDKPLPQRYIITREQSGRLKLLLHQDNALTERSYYCQTTDAQGSTTRENKALEFEIISETESELMADTAEFNCRRTVNGTQVTNGFRQHWEIKFEKVKALGKVYEKKSDYRLINGSLQNQPQDEQVIELYRCLVP